MPTRRRPAAREAAIGLALSVGLTLSLSLVGCSPDAAVPTPPEPTAEPIFASDEEALAAAEEAYAAYLAAADKVAADEGLDADRILPFVAEESHEDRLAEMAPYRERKLRTEGSTRLASTSLQQHWQEGERAYVDMYACLDLSRLRVIDASGQDVTPPRATSVVPFTVSLRSSADANRRLLLVESEVWSGTGVC